MFGLILLRIALFVLVDIVLCVPFFLLLSPLRAILALFRPRTTTQRLLKQADVTVVLIHGSGTSSWQWWPAQLYLFLHGIRNRAVRYNSLQPCAASVSDIEAQISTIEGRLVLVGHSQGALLARDLLHRTKRRSSSSSSWKIAALFSLNGPQRGSALLRWLYPDGCEGYPARNDMALDSDYVKSVGSIDDNNNAAAKETENVVVEKYTVVGLNDFVRPQEAMLPAPVTVYRSWFGHYFSACNPWLWNTFIVQDCNSNLNLNEPKWMLFSSLFLLFIISSSSFSSISFKQFLSKKKTRLIDNKTTTKEKTWDKDPAQHQASPQEPSRKTRRASPRASELDYGSWIPTCLAPSTRRRSPTLSPPRCSSLPHSAVPTG
jgi:pimeloyl-ACP methyl ester carboxylesterase